MPELPDLELDRETLAQLLHDDWPKTLEELEERRAAARAPR